MREEFYDSTLELNPDTPEKSIAFKWICKSLNPRPVFCPFTLRKVLWWTLVVAPIIVGLVFFFPVYYNYITLNFWFIAVIIWILDPLPFIVGIALGNIPPAAPLSKGTLHKTLAVIITCHQSADVIERTLLAALDFVPSNNVFIAHNGNSPTPIDETEAVVSAFAGVNYTWLNVGNKSIAQLVAAKHIQDTRPDIKYVLLLDDDVVMPETFCVCEDDWFSSPNVTGVSFPIRAASDLPVNKRVWTTTMLTDCQIVEYTLQIAWKTFEQRVQHAVTSVHGAVSLFRVEAFVHIMMQHNAVFHGEDRTIGEINARFGWELYYDAQIVFRTFSPQNIPDFFTQRVASWELARFAYFIPQTLRPLFCTCRLHRIAALIVHKFVHLADIFYAFFDALRWPTIAMSLQFWFFYAAMSASMILQMLLLLFYNFVKLRHRPDLQMDTHTFLFFILLYRPMIWITSLFAIVKSFLIQIPNDHPRWSIAHMIKKNTLTLPVFGDWKTGIQEV